MPLWLSLANPASETRPGPQAQAVRDCLATHGALFFDELAEASRLLRSQVEDALAELVALGLVNSDSFGGLRALLVPSAQRKPFAAVKRRGRVLSFGMERAGRWSLIRRQMPEETGEPAGAAAVEHVARTLLRRYGVVFWRLLTREAPWLPPWRDLLRVYRRLEARGEIRGGRFVAGFSGEQYALPEAVGMLRETRRQPASDEWVSLSGADPLNLAGILTPGPRLAAVTSNRILYRDGVPIAVLSGGKAQLLVTLHTALQWEAQNRLLRSAVAAPMADLA
jgi:ATP-dependent helicase Lhr and Lhr-like helicase